MLGHRHSNRSTAAAAISLVSKERLFTEYTDPLESYDTQSTLESNDTTSITEYTAALESYDTQSMHIDAGVHVHLLKPAPLLQREERESV